MGTTFQARRLKLPGERAEWQALHARSRSPWLSLSPEFVAASAGGAEAHVVAVHDGRDRLVGVAPFVVRRERRLATWRHALPAPFGGILVSDEARLAADEGLRRDLLGAVAGYVADHADRAVLVMQPGLHDVRGFLWRGWSASPHYNYVSPLADFEEAMESSARRQAAKAERAGLGLAAIPWERLSSLRRETSARQRIRDLVDDAAYRAIGDLGTPHHAETLGVVDETTGAVHAGGLFAADFSRTYYLLGASSPEHLGSGAPSLLHRAAVAHWRDGHGRPSDYDWVGANVESIARFKREFGPRLEVLMRVEWRGRVARLLDAVG